MCFERVARPVPYIRTAVAGAFLNIGHAHINRSKNYMACPCASGGFRTLGAHWLPTPIPDDHMIRNVEQSAITIPSQTYGDRRNETENGRNGAETAENGENVPREESEMKPERTRAMHVSNGKKCTVKRNKRRRKRGKER